MTEAALFEVRDLSVSYGVQAVVDSISLEVAPGRCLGVIGESGAGKSQAFLALLGLSGQRATVTGHARLHGEDLMGQGASSLRGRRIAMIFQDPLTSLTPHLRIGEQLAEPLMIHRGLARADALARAAELLRSVRVSDVARRLRQYPHELSGGMRQRVMIAMALACDPELLIADEPTTALDVSVQAQLLTLLRQIITERRMSLIIVSHDMGVIAALADDVAVMRAGRIVERGPVHDILANPTHEYTRALIAAMPRMDGPVPLPDRDTPPTDTVLDVRALVVDYSLRAPLWRRAPLLRAVDGVSLSVERGQALGVVGESGCGKSTLARALLRLHDAATGDILWRGRSIRELAGEELLPVRSDLQLVFQDPVASLDPLQRVQDIIEEPLRALRPALGASQRAERARAMLAAVGLGAEYLGRRSRELSGGQCQRVAIARAMVLEPQLLVCDEAVSSLDVSIQAQILELLAGFKRDRGTAIVFVSHNLAVVKQLCERVVVMYLGQVVESGPTHEVFHDPRHPYTRLLLASVPLLDPVAGRARLAAQDAAAGLPSALDRPDGCAFRLRCPMAEDRCAAQRPETERAGVHREVACWRWREGPERVPNEK